MDEQKTNASYPQIHAMEIWVADIPRQPEGGPYGRRPVVILSIDNVGERTEFAPVIPLSSDLSFPQRASHALLHTDGRPLACERGLFHHGNYHKT